MDLRAVVADALDDAVHEHLYADCGDGVSWRDGGREALAGIVLAALAAAGPSEKMVEAGARVLAASWVGPEGDHAARVEAIWRDFTIDARACLTAALAAGREG